MKTNVNQFLKRVGQWVKQARWIVVATCIVALVIGFTGANALASRPPTRVTFYGNPQSSISSGVGIPRNESYFFTSGIVPPSLPGGGYASTTYEQAIGTLEAIEGILKEAGLSMSDVVYLNAYLTPDPATGQVDYRGWFQAYAQYFNNAENPVKTARATLGVQSLVNPAWLIEISAIAIYP